MRLDQLVKPGHLRIVSLVHLDVLDELDDSLAVRGEAVAGDHLGLKIFEDIALRLLTN